jgi:hypothetical protein
MKRAKPGVPLAAATVLSLLLLIGAGLPARVAWADEANEQTITQEEIEVPGSASADDGAVAIAGPAVAYANAVVHQLNVQVATGDPVALANSSQSANNTAGVSQTSVALTGNATAEDGATATTGYAISGGLVVVIQLNIEIMALLSPDCVANQVASNDAQVDQTTAAMSGDATAAGENSNAASGNARAFARSFSIQRNVLIYVCTGRNSGSSADQQAANELVVSQAAAGLSGSAAALDGARAGTGKARAWLSNVQRQVNRQIVID